MKNPETGKLVSTIWDAKTRNKRAKRIAYVPACVLKRQVDEAFRRFWARRGCVVTRWDNVVAKGGAS